jgi:hypothetical protein
MLQVFFAGGQQVAGFRKLKPSANQQTTHLNRHTRDSTGLEI